MKPYSHSAVVRDRLAALGLEKIPTCAVTYIEALMLRELAAIAAKKITVRSVSQAILKAALITNQASDSTQSVAANISPRA
jgi:hypothetical protein